MIPDPWLMETRGTRLALQVLVILGSWASWHLGWWVLSGILGGLAGALIPVVLEAPWATRRRAPLPVVNAAIHPRRCLYCGSVFCVNQGCVVPVPPPPPPPSWLERAAALGLSVLPRF